MQPAVRPEGLHKLTDKLNSPSPCCHSSARHAFWAVHRDGVLCVQPTAETLP